MITDRTLFPELRTLPTTDRLLAMYEYGIVGCADQNAPQVTAALLELETMLDRQYPDLAEKFEHLYGYCLRKTRESEFEQVGLILQWLRSTSIETV